MPGARYDIKVSQQRKLHFPPFQEIGYFREFYTKYLAEAVKKKKALKK